MQTMTRCTLLAERNCAVTKYGNKALRYDRSVKDPEQGTESQFLLPKYHVAL